MGRPPTDPDKRMLGKTVRLTPQQWQFLDQQKEKLDVPYDADVVREVVEGLRTWFALPDYQFEVLEKEMAARKHNWLSYLKEVLARRYEALQREAEGKPK